MNIRLGIYDIFSRIIPGGFYLFVLVQFAVVMQWIKYEWNTLKDVGIIPSLGVLLIAYIMGTSMDRLGSAWHTIFKKRGRSDRVLQEFKDRNSNHWKFEFEDKDWPVLRAYIYIHNPDVADNVDRNNAICIMLRNLSLGLFLLAITTLIQLVITKTLILIILVMLFLFLSYQTAIQARTLRDWFYLGIFETIIAYRINLEERVKPVKVTAKGKSSK